MLNRHGLIAGATGTGKTKTLQLLAEQISAAGVPVFADDMKGDLSGLASSGQSSDKLLARTAAIGQDWQAKAIVTVMDPNGAPTPVAWTRMRAPQSLMAQTPPEVLAPGIAASGLMAKYGQAAAEKEVDAQQKAAERETATQHRQQANKRSVIEEVASSSVFKQFVRSAGREIVRGLFGTALRK